jgi:putative ABC transport system permease protein
LLVESLEGKRRTETIPLVGLAEDFAGIAAYMNIHAVNRFMGEGDLVTGASFTVDGSKRRDFLRSLKEVPRVAWIAVKNSLRENFEKTTAASINLIQSVYLTLATIVSFGVVYNNARISLSERGRELATLRVIGFSQREVATVLITELMILAMIAVPLGLLVGSGFATVILKQVNTETVRVPLILSAKNYASAVLIVTVASTLSAAMVIRKLKKLDLISALKAPE